MQIGILNWDGRSMPEALTKLPPGQYFVEQIEGAPDLTPEEERGILDALDSLDRGEGYSLSEVLASMRDKRSS